MIENPEDQAIQLFKIAIPYPAVRVLSKGRIELLSSPQAKMNIFFTSMPSGHTNFS
jgi:membrane-associated phospholipid phosphatase